VETITSLSGIGSPQIAHERQSLLCVLAHFAQGHVASR